MKSSTITAGGARALPRNPRPRSSPDGLSHRRGRFGGRVGLGNIWKFPLHGWGRAAGGLRGGPTFFASR